MPKRSKNYREAKEKLDKNVYSLEEGLKNVIETSKVKYDDSVEIHMNLGIDPSKGDQLVRGTVKLPHGTGKSLKVAAFVPEDKEKDVKDAGADMVGGEKLIEEIKKTKKCDFDIAVATPDMMRFLGQIAKILGPKGLMPNPKNDTVTPDPEKVIKELKGGKVSFRNDEGANIHQVVGKISFGEEKLLENIKEFVAAINKSKPTSSKGIYFKNVVLCSSMGPAVKVKV